MEFVPTVSLKGDFILMNFISSNRYVRFLQLAVVGLVLWLGLAVFQPVPVKASSTVEIICGVDGGNQVTKTAQVNCAYECNADGAGPAEAPEPIWTELTRSSSESGTVELRCHNWDASYDNTVFLEGGTSAQCLVGAG